MSIAYLAMALKTRLPRAEKIVLLCLAESCNDWGFITPGQKYIAQKAQMSARGVVYALNSLVEKGLIVSHKNPGRPTQYQLRGNEMDIPEITSQSKLAQPEVQQTENLEEKADVILSSSAKSALLDKSTPMEIVDFIGDTGDAKIAAVQNLHYPSLSPYAPPSSPPNGSPCTLSFTPPISPPSPPLSRPATGEPMERLFDIFWKAYPKKVGKANALKSWLKLKLKPEEARSIISHVAIRARRDKQWQNKQYIPHATTFLNGQLWEDEYEIVGRQPDDGPRYPTRETDGPMPWETM